MSCLSCQSISGAKRISPGPVIFQGNFWTVDHAYPTKLVGWLVVVLNRHVESLHELTAEEVLELNRLQSTALKCIAAELQPEKEYIACFSEQEQFKHIHFHVIAKPKDLPAEFVGSKIFGMLKFGENETPPTEKIIELCHKLKERWAEIDSKKP